VLPDNSPQNSPRLSEVLDALGLEGARLESAITDATDTRVWQVSTGDRSLAVRQFRESQWRTMGAELEALRLANKGGIPVPAVIATGAVSGRFPAMAMEWIPGQMVGEVILRQPHLAARLGASAGRLLACIHRLPAGEVSVIDRVDADRRQGSDSTAEEILARIARIPPIGQSILHLDYHPLNLMAVGGRLSGVLDWTNAAIGDPRLDVARSVSILRVVAPAIVGKRGARRLSLGIFARAFLLGYQQTAGPLDQMAPFYAWAGQLMIADLTPKVGMLPVQDPNALGQSIHAWASYWRDRARRD
jgi:aminoglycoside phosphotransferase (APT) family kinase protein